MKLAPLLFVIIAGWAAACERSLPNEPVPIVWDREVCGHCHMAIGEPRFAAQLVTIDGVVTNFDDVGCMLRFIRERAPNIHRAWFHGEGSSWISADQVAFVRTKVSPMGSSLKAVPAGTPGAVSLEDVRVEVLSSGGHP